MTSSPSAEVNPSNVNPDINTTKPRIEWLDYGKGIGIFLVVLGHTIRGLYDSANLATPEQFAGINSWIYSFHMPLFFFLSGVFSYSAQRKSIKSFFSDKFRNIIYPYLVWSVIIGLLRTLSGSNKETLISFVSNLWRLSYYPNDIFWFLYALFLVATVHFFCRRALRKIRFSLVFITGLGVIMHGFYFFYQPPLSGNPIEKLLIYFVYFAVGASLSNFILNDSFHDLCNDLLNNLKPSKIKAPKIKSPQIVLLSGAIAAFSVISLATYFNILITKEPNIILGLVGIMGCLFLAKFLAGIAHDLPRFKFLKTSLKEWGYCSLQIYVMHTAVIAIVRTILQKGLRINDLAVHIFLETMLGIYLPLLLTVFTHKIKFPYLFYIPKSSGNQPNQSN
ncbi:MAG: acyltransferase family protein [Pseudanabaenaceae cyanobacterium]